MWQPKITVLEFEKGYIKRGKISRVQYNRWFITMPCVCDAQECEGWAAIEKSPVIVYDHCRFHFPPISDYLEWVNEQGII